MGSRVWWLEQGSVAKVRVRGLIPEPRTKARAGSQESEPRVRNRLPAVTQDRGRAGKKQAQAITAVVKCFEQPLNCSC